MQLLHILNGSAVLPIWQATGLQGEVAILHELCCHGPLHKHVNTNRFTEIRSGFLQEFLQTDPTVYRKKWGSQIEVIKNWTGDEICLWFEYDLFCQINLLATLQLLSETHPSHSIHLVCVGHAPFAKKTWITLGQLSPSDWNQLFKSRRKLTKNDLGYAAEVWEIYCSENHQKLRPLINKCPGVFTYLPRAFENHCRRFPSIKGRPYPYAKIYPHELRS